MTFGDWKQLSPECAARELGRRAASLGAAQARATFAVLPSAAELTARFAAAPRDLPLGGVPFFVKDLFDVAGQPTRAGSAFLAEVRPTPARDGAIVGALRAAGAVLAGKTHLHEFAYGLTGENPHYGDCEHPRFPGRTTGGSSSGSAAVVAAGVAPLALGTDTGGSIRLPAAFCGLFGFRMTPGHPWIADAFPLAPSFDTAGWFTGNRADMRTTLEALAGPRPPAKQPRGLVMEMPGLEPEVAVAFRAAAAFLIPATPGLRAEDSATAGRLHACFDDSVEAYAVLQSAEALAVHRPWLDSHRERYSPVVWTRIERGRHWLPTQIDAARARRAAICRIWDEFFRDYDFLVLPAAPFPALTKAEFTPENRNRILALTAPASLGGRPVLTVPIPLPSGLSAGMQIVVNDAQSPALDWVLTRNAA